MHSESQQPWQLTDLLLAGLEEHGQPRGGTDSARANCCDSKPRRVTVAALPCSERLMAAMSPSSPGTEHQNITGDHRGALKLLWAQFPLLHSSPQQKASTKATIWRGGKNRLSSFITAGCQAGSQLNFSCALTQVLLVPEISHCWKRSLLSFAPGLQAALPDTPPSPNDRPLPPLLLQGPQAAVMGSFQLPNPPHLGKKLVPASTLYSNGASFPSRSSFYAAVLNGRLATASTEALPPAALRCF